MRAWKLGLSGLLGLAVACAGAHPATSPSPVPNTASADSKGRIPVQIDNQNYSDMDVYLLDRGSRVLLGSVNGLTQATLLLPTGSTATRRSGAAAGGSDRSSHADPYAAAAGRSWGEGVLDHRRRPGGLLRIGGMRLGSAGSAGAWGWRAVAALALTAGPPVAIRSRPPTRTTGRRWWSNPPPTIPVRHRCSPRTGVRGDAGWKDNRRANPALLAMWASPYAVSAGDTLDVYVHSVAAMLLLQVYRLGWYGGVGGQAGGLARRDPRRRAAAVHRPVASALWPARGASPPGW